MSLCEYKDYFGALGKGVHSYRIFNFAIVDVIMTLNDFRPATQQRKSLWSPFGKRKSS